MVGKNTGLNMYHKLNSTAPSQRSSVSNKDAFVIITTLFVGTGTAYCMENASAWIQHLQPRVGFELAKNSGSYQAVAKPDVRSITEHIENIRSVLNPSVSDLANLLDVSRQAVYKWLTGESSPEAEKKDQIVALSKVADEFSVANISRAGSMLKMKAFNGKSLLDILKSGEDCGEYVVALIAEAKVIEASYKQSGLESSKSKPNSNWLSSESIPGSTEQS